MAGDGWKVVMEPQGTRLPDVEKEGEEVPNKSGMILYLVGPTGRHEITRVGFIRRNTKNPEVPFEEQLDKEVEKVRKAMGFLGEIVAQAGELQ
jgi:hypothetical protein